MFSNLLVSLVSLISLALAECPTTDPFWVLAPINLAWYYTFQSPSASGAHSGHISFDFTNDQVAYNTFCEGYSVNPFGVFSGSDSYECVSEGDEEGEARATRFSYDGETKVVSVESSWMCEGGDIVYTSSENGTLDLSCETTAWTNPDWSPGQVFSNTSTVCQPTYLVLELEGGGEM